MANKRRLNHEALESRRLLAGDCVPSEGFVESQIEAPALAAASTAEGETLVVDSSVGDLAFPIASHAFLGYGPDLVQEIGDKVFVVRQEPYSFGEGKLFVLQRDNGSLDPIVELDLGFPVQEMIINGDQVVLIGSRFGDIVPLPLATGEPSGELIDGSGDVPVYEFPRTLVVTVDLVASPDPNSTSVAPEPNMIRQEFEGIFHTIHHDAEDRRLVVVSTVSFNDALVAIYPPPPIDGLIRTFQITPEGLDEGPSQRISGFGLSELRGDHLFIANVVHDGIVYLDGQTDPNTPSGETTNLDTATSIDGIVAPDVPTSPVVHVARYELGPDEIVQDGKLELGVGFLHHFDVSEDGSQALAVRSIYSGATGHTTHVDLIAAESAEPVTSTEDANALTRHETITLEGFVGHVVASNAEYLVLRDFARHSLVIVNINQSIDLAPENRVRERIELPAGLDVHFQSLQVTEDLLVLRATRVPEITDETLTLAGAPIEWRPDVLGKTILLTISIGEGRIIADTHLPDDVHTLPYEPMILIDAATQRLGFVAHRRSATGSESVFQFGHLHQEPSASTDGTPVPAIGEFIPDGSIPIGPRWLEMDANADRFLVRTFHRLLEYDSEGNLINTVPLGEPEPPIEAVDDMYTLRDNGDDHLLNVLANDVVHRWGLVTPVQIVEVIGAPEGTEIVEHGRLIKLPASALNDEMFSFEYVISNGQSESTAKVDIKVVSISDDQVRELVEAVRVQAAEDFGVAVEAVEVISVVRVFDHPIPLDSTNDPGVIDLVPGILVTVKVPDAKALYAASLDGQIVQLWVTPHEFLVELGLRAVDDAGVPLDHVSEGDDFWLEFTAADLRDHARGVYAAFFDLIVPTEHLVITGPIEYGDDFGSIPGGSFTDSEIDDLGAIGALIEHTDAVDSQLLRIGVHAVAAGEITLQPEPADALGTETLLRGDDHAVPDEHVRYSSMRLSIVAAPDPLPLDVDGNGRLTAADALMVINFLGEFGSVLIDPLAAASQVVPEPEPASNLDMATIKRYDTNGDQEITPLDALVVINRLVENQSIVAVSAEAEETDMDAEIPVDDLGQNNLF